MVRLDDYQKSMLVSTAWDYHVMYNNGGHLTCCLIMSCIMNRVKAGWGSLLNVLDTIPKYAAESESPVRCVPEIWTQEFTRCLHEVEGIYDGTLDYAKGGFYWGDLRTIETEFFKETILGQKELHPRVVDMNSFSIFR